MKKLLCILFLLIAVLGSCMGLGRLVSFAEQASSKSATNQEYPQLKFDNKVFKLKYGAYSPMTKSYMNEYFRIRENGDNWTELIGIYYVKKYNSPVEYAKTLTEFAEKTNNLQTQVLYNDKTNIAIASFLLIGDNYIEQNLFKIEKKPNNKKGVVALQYAHKYYVNSAEDVKSLKEVMRKNQIRWTHQIDKTPIPQLIEKEIQTW